MRMMRVALGIIALIAVILIFPWIAPVFGYYIDYPGWEVGKIAAAKRDPSLCSRIFVFSHIFGPPTESRRSECIDRYASITSDPSVCELLLPSEYGLSCISNLWPEVSDHEPCGLKQSDPEIFQCRDKQGVLHQSKRCSDFSGNVKWYSICISDNAEREKSLERCAEIPDPSIRSFCEVRMRAWQKYPELRGSFYFGSL